MTDTATAITKILVNPKDDEATVRFARAAMSSSAAILASYLGTEFAAGQLRRLADAIEQLEGRVIPGGRSQ